MPSHDNDTTTSPATTPGVGDAWTSPRDAATIADLCLDCLGAISRCETGAKGKVRESSMRTVAGVSASYASAGQHIAVKTISTLDKMTPEQLAETGLTKADLKTATRVCTGVRKVWKQATKDDAPATVAALRANVEEKFMPMSRLGDDDLKRMLRGGQMFQELRKAMAGAGGRDRLKSKADKDRRNACAKAFFDSSPLPKELDIRESDIRIYIRTGFGEDRSAWQRLGLEKPAPGQEDDKLGARIKAAAEARGGWQFPLIDIENAVNRSLASDPTASDLTILRAAVDCHAQNARPAYQEKAAGFFRELREQRQAGEGWTTPDGDDTPDTPDAPSSKPAATSSDPIAAAMEPGPDLTRAQDAIKDELELGGSVGRGADNRPDDVRAVVLRLRLLGHLDGAVDAAKLKQGIRDFQSKRAGFKRTDGRVDPGGKSLRALNKAMSAAG